MTTTHPTANQGNPQLYGVPEIADYFNVSERAVRDLISRGKLPVIKIGQRVRVRRDDLDTYLLSNTRQPAR